MRTALITVALVILAFFGSIYVASEYGGEVVHLRTTDAEGEVHETPLWIVDVEGADYLRAGNPESGWLRRLGAHPEVEVERAGQAQRYRAVPAPELSPKVDAQMAEDYGFADKVIDIIRPEGESIAVRLEPLGS